MKIYPVSTSFFQYKSTTKVPLNFFMNIHKRSQDLSSKKDPAKIGEIKTFKVRPVSEIFYWDINRANT